MSDVALALVGEFVEGDRVVVDFPGVAGYRLTVDVYGDGLILVLWWNMLPV